MKSAKLSRPVRNLRNFRNLVCLVRNWPSYLLFRRGFGSQDSILLEFRGPKRRLRLPRGALQTFKEIFLYQDYLTGADDFKSTTPAVVVDIGANIGVFSVFASHYLSAARVIAVEPLSTNLAMLQENAKLNAGLASIVPIHAAVGSKPTVATLVTSSSDDGSVGAHLSTVEIRTFSGHKTFTEQVKVTPLAQLLAEQDISHVDWLKMDCEGAEYDIVFNLERSAFEAIHRLTIEAHELENAPHSAADLLKYLHSLGYVANQHQGGYGRIIQARRQHTSSQMKHFLPPHKQDAPARSAEASVESGAEEQQPNTYDKL